MKEITCWLYFLDLNRPPQRTEKAIKNHMVENNTKGERESRKKKTTAAVTVTAARYRAGNSIIVNGVGISDRELLVDIWKEIREKQKRR